MMKRRGEFLQRLMAWMMSDRTDPPGRETSIGHAQALLGASAGLYLASLRTRRLCTSEFNSVIEDLVQAANDTIRERIEELNRSDSERN